MNSYDSLRPLASLGQHAQRVSRKNRILIFIIVVSLLVTATLMATGPKPEAATAEEKAWPVSAVAVNPQAISPELRLFGRVESPHHANLSSAIAAQVVAVHVREGQTVREGDLLMSLDAADEQLLQQQAEAELMDAEARMNSLKTDFVTDRQVLTHMNKLYTLTSAKAERLKGLNQKQLIATEQLENTLQDVARQGIELARQQALVDKHPQRLASAEAVVKRARAVLANQQLKLSRTTITAPFNGRISTLATSPGDRVVNGSRLLSIYDTSALQVRAAIPANSLPGIKQALASGQPVAARALRPGGNDTVLELTELASEITRGRAGVDGLFALPEGGAGLELGRAVELQLTLPAVADVVALPSQSLYHNQRIFVIRKQRLQALEVVRVGQRINTAGELEVLIDAKQLDPGSVVMTSSLPRAISGLRVQVTDLAAASSTARDTAAAHSSPASPAGPRPG